MDNRCLTEWSLEMPSETFMKIRNANLNFPVFVIREMEAVSDDSSNFDYLELKETLRVESEGMGSYIYI
jgi:hypothetical protein